MKKIYIIAAILALLTGISIYSFAGALEEAAKQEYVEVVAAAVPIPERTILKPEMLQLKSVPVESVLPSALKNIEQAIGLYSDSMLETGEVLSSGKLHKEGETNNGLTYLIPKGMRAFTISVNQVTGVNNFILPDDHVDVLSVLSLAKDKNNLKDVYPTSLIIAQNLEVLATGSLIKVDASGTPVTYTTITLCVTPEEAVTLNIAAAGGELRLILRSPLDSETVSVAPRVAGVVFFD